MSSLHETMQATVKGLLQGYVDASQAQDGKLLSTHLTDDCRRYIGPPAFVEPLGAPPGFSMSNEEYEAEFRKGMSLYRSTHCDLHSLVIDTHNLKAAARTEIHIELGDKKVTRNHCWFLDLSQDGTKIVSLYQLNDTKEGNDWFDMVKSAKEAGV